jgi:hypothetical protein
MRKLSPILLMPLAAALLAARAPSAHASQQQDDQFVACVAPYGVHPVPNPYVTGPNNVVLIGRSVARDIIGGRSPAEEAGALSQSNPSLTPGAANAIVNCAKSIYLTPTN